MPVEAAQAICRAEPEESAGIGNDTRDAFVGEAVSGRVGFDRSRSAQAVPIRAKATPNPMKGPFVRVLAPEAKSISGPLPSRQTLATLGRRPLK